MSIQRATLPDPLRAGVGVVLSSTWSVGSPERQRAAVEAITEAWESRDWPHEGLLSYSVYTGTDGDTLLHYSQWRDLDAYEEFVAAAGNGRDGRNAAIDTAVPGIERLGPGGVSPIFAGPRRLARHLDARPNHPSTSSTREIRAHADAPHQTPRSDPQRSGRRPLGTYELYRSTPPNGGPGRVPGCVVIVDAGFEGPDPQRQRAWVDAVFEALATDAHPHPGGISGHFHTSLDGTRVLNYAEWDSEQAHIDALAGPGEGVGSPTEQWRRVQQYPGLAGGSVKRYLPAVSFSAAG